MKSTIHPALYRALRPALVAGLVSLAWVITGQRVVAQEQPTGPTVELPKLVVTDQRELPPPESWRYADIPGFEILTNASDRSTQQLLRDFGIFRQALDLILPIPTGASAPTKLILCDRGNKFEEFVPSDKSNRAASRASLFLTSREQSAIIIDLGTKTLSFTGADNTPDVKIATKAQKFVVDHDKQLYREYVHFLLSRSEVRRPAWLEEGVMQIIMAMKFDKTSITFGELEDPNEISVLAGFQLQLALLGGSTVSGGGGGRFTG